MFEEWGFLLTEIWVLLALACLIGLLAGWIIWGWGTAEAAPAAEADAAREMKALKDAENQLAAHKTNLTDLTTKLDRCRSDGAKKDARLKEVEAELEELRGQAAFMAPLPAFTAEDETVRTYDENMGAGASENAPTTDDASAQDGIDRDGDGIVEGRNEGAKPATLSEAREGGPDNLKEIKGVGPKMEKMLHGMGFFHFDQIAAWNDDELAWVDANLEGFKGRATRDQWIEQAKILASGEETAFSKRVGDGDVYD